MGPRGPSSIAHAPKPQALLHPENSSYIISTWAFATPNGKALSPQLFWLPALLLTPRDPRPGCALWEEAVMLPGETTPGFDQQQPFLESILG